MSLTVKLKPFFLIHLLEKMASSKFQLGSIENPIKFEDQDYTSLKDASLKSGDLFCDPTFPADQTSIGMPEDPNPDNEVTWLRPKVR